MKGVDISYAPLNAARCVALKEDGQEAIHQCLWTGAEAPGVAGTNIQIALDYGFVVGGYISVTGARSGAWHVDRGYSCIPHSLWDKLALVPTDVELVGIPNWLIRDALEATVGLGKRRAIYTSRQLWIENQGNDPSFADCLLWDADWDGNPDLGGFRPYGGWTSRAGKQFRGGSDQPWGFDTDLDTWDRSVLIGDGMTPEELKEQNEQRLASLMAGDALRRDYAMMEMRLAFLRALAGK